ncbi:hypothetical protein [Cellulosimicrobium sp. Marseille-Q4280]|uniref:hypothetical protein n=1 Tax=Cellulosimicrobium sp. Marseille-Q4280 TaxID=2937992 RepID=UPI00203C0203|nr:hypothetical protein [Cellulosimicrobium sp. Marseille-Q4280]
MERIVDTIRYFKDHSKQTLRELLDDGSDQTLQQVQHQVAVRAGFASWSALRTADEHERRLAVAMLEHPRLNFSGLGMAFFGNTPREQRMQEFRASRQSLRSAAGRVEELRHWLLQTFEPRQTVYDGAGSYGLKHIAEEVLREQMGGYVSNGELIAAALIAGYVHEQRPGDEPNVWFGMRAAGVKAARAAADVALKERSRLGPPTWPDAQGRPGEPSAS